MITLHEDPIIADRYEECLQCHQHVIVWKEESGEEYFDFHYSKYPTVCRGKP